MTNHQSTDYTDYNSGKVGGIEALAWVVLLSGKNLLLVGAPGVGKTQLAIKLAKMAGSDDPVVVTGRDGLTYDELIFGRGNRPGRLAEAVAKSWANLKGGLRPVHLVFDEINRANTDLALGEVFTALDVANRWVGVVPRDAAARAGVGDELLSQFKGEVPLPLSFRVLATMNVVDRAQLFKLSFALLRRFAYLYVAPPWFEWSPTWSPGDAKADLGGLRKFFESAVGELKASKGWDRATIIDIPIPAVDEVLNAHQRFLEFVVWTALRAGDVGLELGVSALVDVFKALAVYEGLKRGNQLELGVERLYDGLYSSLVVHQLAAAVPRLKFNYILGIDHELKRFRGLLGVAKSAFGDRSLTRLVVQSIATELPVEGV
ncbi:MAG: AAA family ATPase [Pyrobaculum sp.]